MQDQLPLLPCVDTAYRICRPLRSVIGSERLAFVNAWMSSNLVASATPVAPTLPDGWPVSPAPSVILRSALGLWSPRPKRRWAETRTSRRRL